MITPILKCCWRHDIHQNDTPKTVTQQNVNVGHQHKNCLFKLDVYGCIIFDKSKNVLLVLLCITGMYY